MKHLFLSLTLVSALAIPAHAANATIDPAEIQHRSKIAKAYHYGVYFPVFVGTFLVGGIPILIHHANVRLDESMQSWAAPVTDASK